MTQNPNQLFSSVTKAANLRAAARHQSPKSFASVVGAPTLALLTPVGYDESVNLWKAWDADGGGANEVQTITVDATGGTFTISFDGSTTAAIAEAATAAAVQAALELLPTVNPGDIVVTGSAGGPFTLTFGGRYAYTNVPAVTTNAGSLTGGAGTAVVAVVTAGVAQSGTQNIRGFIWPAEALLDADEETLHVVMTEGELHIDDIATPSGEDTAVLKAWLQAHGKEYGFYVHGLVKAR